MNWLIRFGLYALCILFQGLFLIPFCFPHTPFAFLVLPFYFPHTPFYFPHTPFCFPHTPFLLSSYPLFAFLVLLVYFFILPVYFLQPIRVNTYSIWKFIVEGAALLKCTYVPQCNSARLSGPFIKVHRLLFYVPADEADYNSTSMFKHLSVKNLSV